MARAIIDEKICKGCGLCVSVCPKKILRLAAHRMNDKGYNPAEVTDEADRKSTRLNSSHAL